MKVGKSKDDILPSQSIQGAEDYQGQRIPRSLTAAFEEFN